MRFPAVGEDGDDLVLVVAEAGQACVGLLDEAAESVQQRGRAAGAVLLRGQVGTFAMGTASSMTAYGSLLSNWTSVSAAMQRQSR